MRRSVIDAVRRTVGAGLALALIACVGAAPEPSASATGPALWRLRDADSEIVLLGTVHVLPPDLQWRTPAIDAAFAGAEVVYFETETDPAAQAEVVQAVASLGRNPPGVTLSSLLPREDAARLKRVTASLQLDPALLEPARPWLAALQLSMRYIVQQGHDPDSGVERVLEAEAQKQNKPRRYFETPEEQVRILATLPEDVQMRFLAATLRQIEEQSESVDAMDDAWVKGDVKRLAAMLNRDIEEAGPEVYAALLTERNARWTAEIDALMKGRGRIFIAVGAAHLAGKDGVPAMLRAKGYTVEGP